jgi:hypothetical protein
MGVITHTYTCRATRRGAPTSPPTHLRTLAKATVAGPTNTALKHARECTPLADNRLSTLSLQQLARMAPAHLLPIMPSVATRRSEPSPWAEAVVPDAN